MLSLAPSVTEWRQYFPCPNLVLITIDHDQVQETEQNKFKTNSNSFRIKHKSKKEFAFSRCVIKINSEREAFKNKQQQHHNNNRTTTTRQHRTLETRDADSQNVFQSMLVISDPVRLKSPAESILICLVTHNLTSKVSGLNTSEAQIHLSLEQEKLSSSRNLTLSRMG